MSEKLDFQFHHVQIFVHKLKSLQEYKKLEQRLNKLANSGHFDPFSGGMRYLEPKAQMDRVLKGREVWKEILSAEEKEKEEGGEGEECKNSDIIEQLIVGLGWRVTAEYAGAGTRCLLVTSADACGVKLCVTALEEEEEEEEKGLYPDCSLFPHFDRELVRTMLDQHGGRQVIGVLGFEVAEGIEEIVRRYGEKHPKLMVHEGLREWKDVRRFCIGGREEVRELGSLRMFEVYAYYKEEEEADKGTRLRFVERRGNYARAEGFSNPLGVLPGLEDVNAKFDGTSIASYSDHWVSNVKDRKRFLQVLEETLGFVPKVEFNAGVVAAGEAMIESTVVGNSSSHLSCKEEEILRDQSQVYLPINNALSEAGHVHTFLQEHGQGIQHLASRVEDLVSFVERVNNYKRMTGRGLSFLSIPRSYYGCLKAEMLESIQLSPGLVKELMSALVAQQLMTRGGIVDLDVTEEQVQNLPVSHDLQEELRRRSDDIVSVLHKSCYNNIFALLQHNLSEDMYLQIVRNRILVDIQGGDVLLQIFTCKILQTSPGQEAPFLEFIERVCKSSSCKLIRPGCGGFGIRNFLTLFLSIEISQAIADEEEATRKGDEISAKKARRRMELLNRQMDESNPILTKISDVMTEEGVCLEQLEVTKTAEERQALQARIEKLAREKSKKTAELQQLSDHFARLTSSCNQGN
mmetsp:Transcript_23147/g.52024  ORF Transcript_23147/g.52024 Transcript_23147/m.52024 type:complete len:689 (-) Transcript_23147:184-2250(-)